MKWIPWAVLGLLVLMMRPLGADGYGTPHLLMSLLVMGLGAVVFWSHGTHQITAAGTFSLAMAVFVGFAGAWVNLVGFGDLVVESAGANVDQGLYLATAVSYFGHVFMYAVFWSRSPEYTPVQIKSIKLYKWSLLLGLAYLALGWLLSITLGTGATQLSLLGCAVIFCAILLGAGSLNSLGLRLALVALLTAFAAVTLFSAFGRLMLVSLGMAALVTASAVGYRHVKVWTLLALPPALWALVAFREAAQRDLGIEENGLGSVLAPVVTFGRLINEGYAGVGGDTFLASVLWWIPRSLWPDKPDGLGAQIASWLEPEAASRGHSMASSGFGEWYFNGGWIGVVLFVIVFGFLVKKLDAFLQARTRAGIRNKVSFIIWMAVAILVAELPAFAWSGTFTYSTRAGMKLVFLVIGWMLVVRMFSSEEQHRPRQLV